MGDACWRELCACFGLLSHTHMLFAFGHELFLHVVFAEATGLDWFGLVWTLTVFAWLELSVVFGLFRTVFMSLILNS